MVAPQACGQAPDGARDDTGSVAGQGRLPGAMRERAAGDAAGDTAVEAAVGAALVAPGHAAAGVLPRPPLASAWLAAAAGWLAGLAWQLQQPLLWPLHLQACGVAAGLALLLLARRWPWARAATGGGPGGPLPAGTGRTATHAAALGLVALSAAAMAVSSTGWRAHERLADRLAPALEGRNLWVTGVVASLPQAGPSGLRFLFRPESATLQGQPDNGTANLPSRLPKQLALGWYDGWFDDAWLAEPRPDVRAGQRWRLPLRLKRPHATLNPDGYDAELAWFEQGTGATGFVRVVRGGPPAELLAEGVAHPVARLRQTVRDAIGRQVTDGRTAGVLAALVVGDQAAIDRDDWELFRRTGVAHLVAISGVHITMLAWLAGLAIQGGWRHSRRLALWVPAPLAARWGGLLVAVAYAVLAGWGVPAQRTVLMLATVVLLRSGAVRWPVLGVLLAAAVVVTVVDPWALLQAGFWLSFAAVALLMLSGPAQSHGDPHARGAQPSAHADSRQHPGWLARWRSPVTEHVRTQWVASIGLAPLSLVFFQQVSVVGLLANLLAIPLVTMVVTPLALAGMLVAPLWTVAATVVQAGVAGLAWLASWPLAVWTAAAAPPWVLAGALLGAALAVAPLPWALRVLALPLVLPLLWPVVPRPANGQFHVLAADIGQGTAVLVRTQHHLLLYDTGPQYTREADAGQRVLLPLLRARGETAVDLLVLSHRDADHVGGAASLLAALPVRALSSSLTADHPLRQRTEPHHRCEAGQQWAWDGVHFSVLHPTPEEHAAARKPNEVSCVLRVVDAAGHSLLLTGDIEAGQEAALLRRTAVAAAQGTAHPGLASTVLLVPHHGSRTSSTGAFLDAVAPQVAVVQAAYRSRFGHPAPDVLGRYQARGVSVVRSDECGGWAWRSGDAAGHCTRVVRRRYWHAALPAEAAASRQTLAPR